MSIIASRTSPNGRSRTHFTALDRCLAKLSAKKPEPDALPPDEPAVETTFRKSRTPPTPTESETTFRKSRGEGRATPLAKLKARFRQRLYLPHDEVIDLLLGVAATNAWKYDPIWLHVISPPSSGKTELLTSLLKREGSYFLDDFTAHAWV